MNYLKIALISIIFTLFTACDSSNYTLSDEESSGDKFTTEGLTGVVVDGYISDATVCLDVNSDGSCTDELTTQTDINGQFSFSDLTPNEDSLIVVVSSGGIDTSTDKEFDGELKRVVDLSLVANGDEVIVSPFTDLAALHFLNSTTKDSIALSDAQAKVSTIFGS